MVTGGHKEGKNEGKKRGQKRGHNMLYTRVTSTKSLPPSSHPKKSNGQDKTQGEKSKSDVDSTTDNEGLRQTMLKRSTFCQKTFPFKFLKS